VGHVLRIWVTHGHAMTMEDAGLVLYSTYHPKPAPHIMSSKVKEDIQRVVSDDSTKSTKDITKGLGIGYVPPKPSSPTANTDRVRRERKMARSKWVSVHKDLCPLDEILNFEKFERRWKVTSCTIKARALPSN